jgi:uncharacterized protein (DUF433 family)
MAISQASQDEQAARLRQEQELIDRWIELSPRAPGYAEVVVADYGVSVWLLVNIWLHADGDIAAVMQHYDLPEEAVRAVLAYYRRHKALIDAKILIEDDILADPR